tara:strand:+ start:131 stop:673 length:543 start_codon:yes stop_codon:yes gene_type:complete
MNKNPVSIDQNDKILDITTMNGRVNIVDIPYDVKFQMQEKIAIKNKASEYREALNGVLENTMLSRAYFSAENIQIIQNALRAGVHKMSNGGIVIPPQNLDTLKIIMRSIYLQYAEHSEHDIPGQIQRLNKLVLDYAIPNVYNEAEGYIKYCRDQSTLATPMELPKPSDRVYKQLELKPWV